LSVMKHHRRHTFASCIKPIVKTLQQMQLNTGAHQITQQLGGGPCIFWIWLRTRSMKSSRSS
jgi:hypothetical protein